MMTHIFRSILVTLLSVSSVNAECTVGVISYGSPNQATVGDVVEDGAAVTYICDQEYAIAGQINPELTCTDASFPAVTSCRLVEVTSSDTVYPAGSDITLTCDVTSDDKVTSVTWLKDDVDLSLPSTLTASSPYRSEVTVLATTSGTYTCTATLENPPPYDEEPTALPLLLTVVDVEMSPAEEGPVYVLLDSPIPLTCVFDTLSDHQLTISWTMGNAVVTNQARYETDTDTAKTTSYLSMEALENPNYSNTYKCAGLYEKVSNSRQFRVEESRAVEVRGITTSPSSVITGAGMDTTFTCEAVGEEAGEVSWRVGGLVQEDTLYTTTYTLADRETQSVLSLGNLATQYDTPVQCSVQYKDTPYQATPATLTVQDFGIITHPEDTGMRFDGSGELSCVVKSEKDIVPDIVWLKRSSQLSFDKYSKEPNAEGTIYTSTLYFQDVKYSSNGEYTCRVAYTVQGKTTTFLSDPAKVYVRAVTIYPTISVVSSDADAAKVKQFTCYLESDTSEPDEDSVQSITWYVNNIDIKNEANFEINAGSFTRTGTWRSVLTMKNIQPALAGKVNCVYSCAVGGSMDGTQWIYVHRLDPPPAITEIATSAFTITCASNTNEEATVSWKKNGATIGQNDPNFEPKDRVYENYRQTNSLEVVEWSALKDIPVITCNYKYEITGTVAKAQTTIIFKGFSDLPSLYYYWSKAARSLYCSFGYTYNEPAPSETSWLKDGASIAGNSRYEIKPDDSQTGSLTTELRIVGSGAGGDDDVTFADGGAFTCSFHYSDSEIYTATSTVNFYSISVTPVEGDFYDGPSITLTCTVESKEQIVQSVTWKKDGEEVSDADNLFRITSAPEQGTGVYETKIEILEVVASNGGEYECVLNVQNDEISGKKNIQIENIQSRGWTLDEGTTMTDSYLQASVGQKVTMICSVDPFTTQDTAEFSWYKDGAKLIGSQSNKLFGSDLYRYLTISSLKVSDQGEYRCGIGASRSIQSTTVTFSDVETADLVILKGSEEAKFVNCRLTSSSAEPSDVYWTDSASKEYRSSDAAGTGLTVTESKYEGGSQTTTLTLDSVEASSEFTCFFVLASYSANRRVTVTLLEITTSPTPLVYLGSPDTKVSCKISGTQEATVTWSTEPGHVTTITTPPRSLDTLTTFIEVKEVKRDLEYTCSYVVSELTFTGTVKITVYEVTLPPSFIILKDASLTMELEMEPEVSDTSNYIRSVAVSQNTTTTINGNGAVSGSTITYERVVAPMVVNIGFQDSTDVDQSASTTIHSISFSKSKVSITDGSSATLLTCVLKGVLPENTAITAFWGPPGDRTNTGEVVPTGDVVTTKHSVTVSELIGDQQVPCGFTIQDTEYTHSATLDLIRLDCSSNIKLGEGETKDISCVISSSDHIEPVQAVWYRGNTQELVADLTSKGWPEPITTTLPVSAEGTYRCVVDMGVKEFTKKIVVSRDSIIIDPDPEDEVVASDSNVGLIVGLTVPVIIIIIVLVVVVGHCYLKRHRKRRASITVKTLSINSNSNRPESLIYANDGGYSGNTVSRVARYSSPEPTQEVTSNLRVNYRARVPPNPNKGAAPAAPRAAAAPARPAPARPTAAPGAARAGPVYNNYDNSQSSSRDSNTSGEFRFNRDFEGHVYSNNMGNRPPTPRGDRDSIQLPSGRFSNC